MAAVPGTPDGPAAHGRRAVAGAGDVGAEPADDGAGLDALDDPDHAVYTVGQAARLLGVSPAALRRLDQSGAVDPDRSGGGQRRYTRRQLERSSRLLRLLGTGYSLAGAGRVVELEDEVGELRAEVTTLRERRTGRGTPAHREPPP